ncbi:hypothetical protein SDC9_157128 [bioreactor metagenome]|uniref:Uncharacterized protein n=1 Tax=bioreactor metagenome TaxID=1076179 RepID=A0A645F891_9ZZZZ|nr:hypothetical protein [Candidatus Metalachnospira sp.]
MKKSKTKIGLLIVIFTLIIICFFILYFKSMPLIQTPNECSIIDIQHNVDEELIEINDYDSNAVISLLSKCSKKRTLDKAYAPLPNDNGGYVIILYDNDELLHIRLGEDSVCDSGHGTTIYNIVYQGDIKKVLQKVLNIKS